MKRFSYWWQATKVLLFGRSNTEPILDHVPVNGNKSYKKKLAQARERHGKEFHAHEKKPRETKPSSALVTIQEAQPSLPAKDTQQKVRSIKIKGSA